MNNKLLRQAGLFAAALAAIAVLAMPVRAADETRVALVIGNAHYADLTPLLSPIRDAEALAKVLRENGFSSVTVSTDATRADLEAALADFAKEAAKADWAVVYFAGHGVEVDGRGYLIPVDARIKTGSELGDQAVSLTRVIEATAPAGKLGLILFDAGRQNPFG